MWQSVYYKHFEDDFESAFIHNAQVLPYAVACSDAEEQKALIRKLKRDGFQCVGADEDSLTLLINIEFRRWCKQPATFNSPVKNESALNTEQFLTKIYAPTLLNV